MPDDLAFMDATAQAELVSSGQALAQGAGRRRERGWLGRSVPGRGGRGGLVRS
jgi:hypothetical protein